MPGPTPKTIRRRRNAPARGEWTATPGVGWQHGPIPAPLVALHKEAMLAWTTWMRSWVAAHWTPEDLPGLNVVIGLYDQMLDYLREPFIEKEYVTTKGDTRTVWVAKPNPAGELRQYLDNYGITKKGQQDRRWVAPKPTEEPAPGDDQGDPYGGLRVIV